MSKLEAGADYFVGVYVINESVHSLTFPQLGMRRQRLGIQTSLLSFAKFAGPGRCGGGGRLRIMCRKACRSFGANFPANLNEEVPAPTELVAYHRNWDIDIKCGVCETIGWTWIVGHMFAEKMCRRGM